MTLTQTCDAALGQERLLVVVATLELILRGDRGGPCSLSIDFRLLRDRLFHYRSSHHIAQMLFARIVPLIAVLSWITVAYANVPIVIETGDAKRKVMKLCSDASNQLRDGDVASAKRNINEALRLDPKLWPAMYVRAEIFAREGKYELAIQDCNEALRQNRAFIDAALLRARINVALGKYAEASKEYDSLIAMHPATVTLARALSERAWFQATCPNGSFRNGQRAVKDAKAACSIVAWRDEDMIDTLAVACARGR